MQRADGEIAGSEFKTKKGTKEYDSDSIKWRDVVWISLLQMLAPNTKLCSCAINGSRLLRGIAQETLMRI